MTVIDAHAHVYPEKIALKAVEAVGRFYGVEQSMAGKGSSDDLLGYCDRSAITHFIIHSVATTARSVSTINTFLAEQGAAHPEFIAFGTMHPDCPDMEAEVDRALTLGLLITLGLVAFTLIGFATINPRHAYPLSAPPRQPPKAPP